jgi:hypothetical protein
MYNFVSLSLKCPHCSASLMDPDTLVDNETSIALHIDIAKKKGDINLSSIYGSYNYSCNIDCPIDEVAVFSCPQCGKVLNYDAECKICKAPMASLILDMGGKISICTRSGCKNHNVEFDDLNVALKKMYQEFGYQKNLADERVEIVHPEKPKDENMEILETGTFLQAYCPHCRKSLIENDMLKLKLVNDKDEEGFVLLSPYLNVFSTKSTVFLAEGKPVGDLRCFHCDHTLMIDDKKCELCDSPVGMISISARSKLIDFFLCSKKGCRWHGLSQEDLSDIKLDDSLEW